MSGFVAGAVVVGSIISSNAQSKAAGRAADAQSAAADTAAGAQLRSAELGIEEQRRQFEETTRLLAPYISAGAAALPGYEPIREAGARAFEQQQALAGLLGPAAQTAAISQLEQSGEFQALTRQGEEALLQRASATGGLRGGNIQAALAQFRPAMLSEQIERQLGRLGGFSAAGFGATSELAGFGQAGAARQAVIGQQSSAAIQGLLGQQGSALSGAALARGQAQAGQALAQGQAISNLGQSLPSAFILGRSFQQPSFQFASNPRSSGAIAPSYGYAPGVTVTV